MSNELQIRISADIKQLKTAMSRTEQLLKNADNVLKQSSRSAFQLENSLAQLAKQFKAGSISEAEFNKQSTLVTKELERQRANVRASEQEIRRLNSSLGSLKTRGASTGTRQLGNNMSNLTGQVRGANNVALEFNRIIQDAPFGIMGVGNNLQQLAANFSNVSRNAGGTGAAIKASLSALITPANLALLAISAVTSALTVYAMNSRGAKKEVDDLKEAQDSLNDSLKETDRLARKEFYQQTLKDLGILQDVVTNTGRVFKNVFTDKTAEERLALISDRIRKATKPELEVLARFLKEEYQDAIRQASLATEDLDKKLKGIEPGSLEESLALSEIEEFENKAAQMEKQLVLVNKQLEFYKSDTDKAKKSTDDFNKSIEKEVTELEKLATLYAEISNNLDEIEKSGLLKGKGGIIDFGVNLGDAPPVEEVLPSGEERELLTKNQLDLLERAGIEIKNQTTLTNQQIESYKKLANELNTIDQLSSMLGDSLSRSFESALFEGESFVESFQKAFTEMLKRLASQLLASAVLKILGAIVGGPAGGVISSGAGNIFGGARANGGPVSSSKAYLVGERGPEIFQPSTSGRIIPNIPSSPMVSASGASAGVMQKIDVNVYGEIMNDRIVLSEARGNRANGRFYGINN